VFDASAGMGRELSGIRQFGGEFPLFLQGRKSRIGYV
jgi:hypothetical protein